LHSAKKSLSPDALRRVVSVQQIADTDDRAPLVAPDQQLQAVNPALKNGPGVAGVKLVIGKRATPAARRAKYKKDLAKYVKRFPVSRHSITGAVHRDLALDGMYVVRIGEDQRLAVKLADTGVTTFVDIVYVAQTPAGAVAVKAAAAAGEVRPKFNCRPSSLDEGGMVAFGTNARTQDS
jgi:hypothetical protein